MSAQKSLANVQQETVTYRVSGRVASRLRKSIASFVVDAVALVVIGIIFVVPFLFILLTAAKSRPEAALFQFSWPSHFSVVENIQEGLTFWDNRMFLAMWNSTVLTVGSVTLIVLLSAL